jgi:hypothetical protein
MKYRLITLLIGMALIPRATLSSEHVADSASAPGIGFPQSDYTPFGYLDNPAHSAVLDRSGVIRSVPPLGFGFWAREMPWPYGLGALRAVNYLSLLHLSFSMDGVHLITGGDFSANHIAVISRYHTKNLFSYDWEYQSLGVSIRYFLATPDALVAIVSVHNSGNSARTLAVNATNEYGYPEREWWGSDGVAAQFSDADIGLTKIWAYGDTFALGANRESIARKATASAQIWRSWLASDDTSVNTGSSARFPDAMYTVQTYRMNISPGADETMTLVLARGVNEARALSTFQETMRSAPQVLISKLTEDDEFYSGAPVLTGDWDQSWKHGWIYDLETLRMTVRPPLGIYKHPWDGMQIFTPRVVLGETALDMMALSYADVKLAEEVILGAFADAPSPNVPCSREDGSMNMICADGSEVGTAPTWGMPFHVIRSIYNRDPDATWVHALYPHLKRFLDWWLANRTDKDGWFHSRCSLESGQDGSKRFLVANSDAYAVTDYVRTVDIEAAMAEAFETMVLFAEVSGQSQDVAPWRELALKRKRTTRAMYVDGWFRDFDARDGKPIILKDYYDVMMLYPLAAGIATPQQAAALAPRFQYFQQHAKFWLEWPSFMLPFSEAAWNSGQRGLIGEVVSDTAARVYRRRDAREVTPARGDYVDPNPLVKFPTRFYYRIPGVSDEYWPIDEDDPGGGENYGWGATLPTLIIRNVIGFREFDDPMKDEFRLAPALPAALLIPGRRYGITNLGFRNRRFDVIYKVETGGLLKVEVTMRLPRLGELQVRDTGGKVIATARPRLDRVDLEFDGVNRQIYIVSLR